MNTTNIFFNMILDRQNYKSKNIFGRLHHKWTVYKFRKTILKGSPSFGLLWKMADFVKLAEEIYFYDNSTKKNTGLFSSINYAIGENGFKVFHYDCNITIKLFSDTQKVALEVDRLHGNKIKSNLVFINESWDGNPGIYDELLLDRLITIINNSIISLFDECYDK